jgi:leader peptidase (prepilin peptidase) / N-methyltransferase
MVNTPWGPFPILLIYPFVLFLGLALGSFANVLIYRLPREESLITPPSRCPSCGRPIRPIENIPVISWILLGGKCKGCKTRISIRYPLVELISGILFTATFGIYGFEYLSLAYGLLFIALVALIVIDLEHWLLPFAITIPMTLVALAGSIFFQTRSIVDCLLGMATGFGIFILMLVGGKVLFKKEALGGGDVVFGMMAGAFIGWKLTILMIFIASFLGTLIAIPMLIAGKDISSKAIPFGPFLAISLVICIFTGDAILEWYLRLISG